jgi:Insertion element 4 transposase N-terminal
MALFRNRSIHELVGKLNLVLPGRTPTVSSSAVTQARARLGAEPLEWLFVVSADHWAHRSADAHRWRGLALYGVDGSTLRVADSEENRDHFGGTKGKRGQSGYPLVRLVGLMALRSHLLVNVAFGPLPNGVKSPMPPQLWPSVPDNSLTILDKGFLSAAILILLTRDGKEPSLAHARQEEYALDGAQTAGAERPCGGDEGVWSGPARKIPPCH